MGDNDEMSCSTRKLAWVRGALFVYLFGPRFYLGVELYLRCFFCSMT